MIEAYGNIFNMPYENTGICITTNGMTRNDGTAIMGAGIAKEAYCRLPEIATILGKLLKENGNHVYHICRVATHFDVNKFFRVFSFPTKNEFWKDSDLGLIEQSCKELVSLTDEFGLEKVYLPRPGCSNGHLDWKDVKPILEKYLDDRFVVVTKRTYHYI